VVERSAARAPVSSCLADVRTDLRRFRSDLIWWMFVFSLGTLLGTAALVVLLR
jgi:hypothetical protein